MKPDTFLQGFVAVGIVLLMGACLAAVVFVPIPKDQLNLFTALASGVIGSAFGGLAGYLYGSSLGSKNKDSALLNQP
jgi:membrane protein DedA with SNARE-associated domain